MTAFTEADRRKILESLTQVNLKKIFFLLYFLIFFLNSMNALIDVLLELYADVLNI